MTYLDDRQQAITRTGEIIHYDAHELRLRLPQGTTRRIATARVTEVQADRSAEHRKADDAFAVRDYGLALSSYRAAYQDEPRWWVKQQLVAQSILCQRNLHQVGPAATTFLALITQDPETPFADVAPLAWRSEMPDRTFERRATAWLNDARPAARLIAASWLLSGRYRSAAQKALRQLGGGQSNDWIVQLAQAQLWRSQSVTADRERIGQWQRRLASIPEKLQAGPRFVVARALANNGDAEAATIAYLQVALMYEQPDSLVVESLWAAGRLLEEDNHPAEARRVYRELADRFPETSLADDALGALRHLKIDPSGR